ncbi:iron donor protein CyaY [Ferrimonas sediminicola]|uniref:Iron-sulfur cluster assembly protein CyaY n=1 Tax=Ferrimonas sediminicola TaxID=2569538 RepID=A0A4U1BID4_9GAMM|nr:iron donor protein CyaY [Ferrimonas sediminicola]TKB51083.1 iron donor protein CyaY [Ferrimonas sediminicola]
MAMDQSRFHELADETLERIAETIDDAELELDYEQSGNVLDLECIDGSHIVLNKQEAMSQLWLATKFGGYRFDFREGGWVEERGGQELLSFLSESVARQGGEQISF